MQLHNGPIVWTESKLANSLKSCHYADRGYWDAHTRQCISWHFLAKLFVKLEIEPNTGRWRSSNRYGNVGCNVYQQFEPVGSHKLQVQNWRVNTPPNITMEQVCCAHHRVSGNLERASHCSCRTGHCFPACTEFALSVPGLVVFVTLGQRSTLGSMESR